MSAKKQAQNGAPASMLTGSDSSKQPLATPTKELKNKLAAVYNQFNSAQARDRKQRSDWFVFHMTDWLDDLRKLENLYAHPDEFSNEAAGDVVAGVLYHALNHLTAAARLLLDYQPGDVFKDVEENPGNKAPATEPRKK
jgi:hypothetical protein